MSEAVTCVKCAAANPAANKFCAACGTALAAPPASGKTPLVWKWVAIGTVVVAGLQVFAGVIIALLSKDPQHLMENAASVVALVVASIVSYPVAGALVAYWSPGLTLREPAIGAAIAVIGFNLLNGSFGGGALVLGWLLPFGLTLLGAKLGERLQGRAQS
jgi:hypothetical protein